MRPYKIDFTATAMLILCLWGTGCGLSTDARPKRAPPRFQLDTLPGDAADVLAKLRDLKAETSVAKNGLGNDVISIDLSLVHDVTPALRLVADLPSVDRLSLLDADLSAEDFELLRKLRMLRWLDLSNTNVADADLSFLLATPQLEFLLLWSTGISDAGLAHIAQLQRLQKLDLSGTHISESGLLRLTKLHELLELYVEVPRMSTSAIERLQHQLPNTLIVY